jgi:hypothetical protein
MPLKKKSATNIATKAKTGVKTSTILGTLDYGICGLKS